MSNSGSRSPSSVPIDPEPVTDLGVDRSSHRGSPREDYSYGIEPYNVYDSPFVDPTQGGSNQIMAREQKGSDFYVGLERPPTLTPYGLGGNQDLSMGGNRQSRVSRPAVPREPSQPVVPESGQSWGDRDSMNRVSNAFASNIYSQGEVNDRQGGINFTNQSPRETFLAGNGSRKSYSPLNSNVGERGDAHPGSFMYTQAEYSRSMPREWFTSPGMRTNRSPAWEIQPKNRDNVSYDKAQRGTNIVEKSYPYEGDYQQPHFASVSRAYQTTPGQPPHLTMSDDIPVFPKALMYDGVRSWEAFATKYIRYSNARRWSDRERFENLCWCLEGKAGDYYPVACMGLAYDDFDMLLSRFAAKYGNQDLLEIMESSFHDASQAPDESVSDWADRISIMGDRIMGGLSDQQYTSRQIVTKFCGGLLDKEMGEYVTRQRPKNLDEALENVKWALHSRRVVRGRVRREVRQVLINEDDMNRGVTVASVSHTPKPHNNCKLEGRVSELEKNLSDFISKCSKEFDQFNRKLDWLLSKRNSSSSPDRSPGGQVICFHCQEPGHFRNECPKNRDQGEDKRPSPVPEKRVIFSLPKNANGAESRA